MKINWFPGHMKKTLDELTEKVKLADIVLYLLDARAPISTLNPQFQKIIANKPIIFVVNKIDFINEENLTGLDRILQKDNTSVVYLDSTKPNAYKQILSKTQSMLIKKIERNKQKGINIPLRMVVIGVPNVGKSTLINNFAKKNKAEAHNKPGVTKTTQWVKVDNNIELLDTPGTLWPNFEEESVALHLAYIGSIKDEVLILTDLCYEFIKETAYKFSKNYLERYNIITENKEPIEIYEDICKNRGFLLKNREFDYERGAKAILDDFRKGKLGKIVLDDIKL